VASPQADARVVECVVLAGGTPGPRDPLAAHTGGRPKALLELAGRPMIAWVLDALLGSRHLERVIVVGLEAAALAGQPARVETIPDHGSMVANFYAGLARLSGSGPAAFCWSDIPLISAAMVDRFIESVDPELDLNVGLVPRTGLQARYPEADDLWLRLREGQFIAADFGLFHPRQTARVRPILEALEPLRKSAARAAWQLGLPLVIRYLTRRLAMADLERYVARRLGVRCGVRVVDDPELGLDVDAPHDLALCRRVLAERGARS
jgi:molybdopterin-guanine dinucleotide biosynthesis protein A